MKEEIKNLVIEGNEDYDLVMWEIGGKVGDIEEMKFMEEIRKIGKELKRGKEVYIKMKMMKYIKDEGELKKKKKKN